jgi:hypothetical protein
VTDARQMCVMGNFAVGLLQKYFDQKTQLVAIYALKLAPGDDYKIVHRTAGAACWEEVNFLSAIKPMLLLACQKSFLCLKTKKS